MPAKKKAPAKEKKAPAKGKKAEEPVAAAEQPANPTASEEGPVPEEAAPAPAPARVIGTKRGRGKASSIDEPAPSSSTHAEPETSQQQPEQNAFPPPPPPGPPPATAESTSSEVEQAPPTKRGKVEPTVASEQRQTPQQPQHQQQQPPPPPPPQQQPQHHHQQPPPPPPPQQQHQFMPPPPPGLPPSIAFPPSAQGHVPAPPSGTMVIASAPSSTALTTQGKFKKNRTSELQHPNVALLGHEAAVYAATFEPLEGRSFATAGMEGKILLWSAFGECENYNVMTGHKSAILEMHWLHTGNTIVSCSADHTAGLWDADKGVRIKKFVEHTGIVNTCSVARSNPHLFATGSDDCTAILWDTRSKTSVATMYHNYQVTSIAMSNDGSTVYSGSIDNIVRSWDVRNGDPRKETLVLRGHGDMVTGLALSPDEAFLLSNSSDSTLRTWDVRPFSSSEQRCVRVFSGLHHGAEKLLLRCAWSADQRRVTCGSADRCVHIWDADTAQPIYRLGGHKASVNEVIFHPQQSQIILSVSSDKTVLLGELST